MYNQTVVSSGFKKFNNSGGSFRGFAYKILIPVHELHKRKVRRSFQSNIFDKALKRCILPKVMNGPEKSMTVFLS